MAAKSAENGAGAGVRLTTVATLVVGIIGALGVVASVALVVATAELHRSSRQMLEAAESINASQELESNVQRHSSESVLWEQSGDPEHRVRRDGARFGVDTWFKQMRKYVEDPAEVRMVDSAEAAVKAYLTERDRLEEVGLTANEISDQVAAPLATALTQLSLLTDRNVAEATADYRAAVQLDRRSDVFGIVVVILILIAIPAVFVVLNRLVFRPLKQVARSLRDFGSGKPIEPISSGAQEIQKVSSTLADLANQIQRQTESRVRYLAAVAHDLRNPISAIKMSSEILTQEGIDLGGETKTFLEVIQRQSSHLNRMVGDLLETTRIEAGQVELRLHQQDLRQCVGDCVELFRHYSEAHPLRFVASPEPVPCHFDPMRISQVVNNLISNAIKYSPFGGEVQVRVERRGSDAVVAVSDLGSGIAPEELSSIFQAFHRSKATRETIPGVGLGLHTARKLVQAHRGRIEVESQVGVGSTFKVILPASDAPEAGVNSATLALAELSGASSSVH